MKSVRHKSVCWLVNDNALDMICNLFSYGLLMAYSWPWFIQEEEDKAQKAREEEAAALEFEKWKGEFSVDDEGTLEEVSGGNQDLLADFVEYIKVLLCPAPVRILLFLIFLLSNMQTYIFQLGFKV